MSKKSEYLQRQLEILENSETSRHFLMMEEASSLCDPDLSLPSLKVSIEGNIILTSRYRVLQYKTTHTQQSLADFWHTIILSELETPSATDSSEGLSMLKSYLEWHEHFIAHNDSNRGLDGFEAWQMMLAYLAQTNQRLVLLIEDMTDLLATLSGPHQWRFRSVLQLRDGPVVLAKAKSLPRDYYGPDAAFYDFFHIL